MQIAKEFTKVMGDRLRHMHVSGCTASESHAPLYRADNREQVASILPMTRGKPLILESVVSDINEINEELGFVRLCV